MSIHITRPIEENESPILIDMGKYGFKKVIVQTTTNEIRETLENDFKDFNLQNLVINLILGYKNIDEIYETAKWDDFMNDCVIYSCFMQKERNKPIQVYDGDDIQVIRIF